MIFVFLFTAPFSGAGASSYPADSSCRQYLFRTNDRLFFHPLVFDLQPRIRQRRIFEGVHWHVFCHSVLSIVAASVKGIDAAGNKKTYKGGRSIRRKEELHAFLENELGLTHHAIEKLRENTNNFSRVSPVEEFRGVTEFLLERGFNNEDCTTLLERFPQILRFSKDKIRRRVETFLRSGIEECVLVRLVRGDPSILLLKSKNVKAKLLSLGHDFGLNLTHGRAARLVELSVENVQRKLDLFATHGFSPEQIARISDSAPDILCLSVSRLVESFEFFKRLGLDEPQLCKMVTRYPVILRPSISTLQARTDFCKNELKIDGRDLCVVLARFPQLATRGLGYMRDQVELLRLYNLSDEQIRVVLLRCPSVLGITPQNVKQKLDFLLERFDIDNISRNPPVLALSFSNRVQPRVLFVEQRGLRRSLSTICLQTEAKFCESFGCSLGEFARFRESLALTPETEV
mmetsp:Transcript_23176/g.39810  ORF Transcript_23176/g.39810 Transcript_23176/m.39810 type:complete len:460 (-) Transcript_23176:209-1588(-)|eukprot:CAMPEP_0196660370 /NCGR_PEP_ID=MMETSP1086-20130531/39366_1 /TAXON_ID=77921 /ORGANISM="Cyanoptyche  gloeocystis , Strain SAG4.97" /LENGTH=459 /DNA_ID=CAMNT_0041994737 /DNA_START=49 /DNA_END=1428 /DNA_ORIENTATION=-